MNGLMYPGGDSKPKSGQILGIYRWDQDGGVNLNRSCNTKYMSSGINFIKKAKVRVTAYVQRAMYRITVYVSVAGQTFVSYPDNALGSNATHTKELTVNPGDSISVWGSHNQNWTPVIVLTEFLE